MNATAGKLRRIDHVELRVRDLAQSAAFYERLLGLTRCASCDPDDGVSVYLSEAPDAQFSIILVEGVPAGMELGGMDHVCLEVATVNDVDEIHAAAKTAGTQTTDPTLYRDRYRTYVFDPNGYKIEIAARPRNGRAAAP